MRRSYLMLALAILPLALGLTFSCEKGSVDKLSGSSGNTCDTVGMKYMEDVVPILSANCYSCHGTGNTAGSGGVLLEGYANLKPYATNGYLVGNISHSPGYDPMPFGLPQMDACNINTIVDWVNNGALDN